MANVINAELTVAQEMSCLMAANSFYRELFFNGHSEAVNALITKEGPDVVEQRIEALSHKFKNDPELDTPEKVLKKLQEHEVPVTEEQLLGCFLLIEQGNPRGGVLLAEILAEYAARE